MVKSKDGAGLPHHRKRDHASNLGRNLHRHILPEERQKQSERDRTCQGIMHDIEQRRRHLHQTTIGDVVKRKQYARTRADIIAPRITTETGPQNHQHAEKTHTDRDHAIRAQPLTEQEGRDSSNDDRRQHEDSGCIRKRNI